jgi:peptide-methionine (S)-S-oxide reductase
MEGDRMIQNIVPTILFSAILFAQNGSNSLTTKGTAMTQYEQATLGAGCFWCVEAVFQRLPGVVSVMPGYAGGAKANPTYQEVCTGKTGHAEVAQVTYDPTKIGYEKLLEVFWEAHDPTTLNRQGADVGTQYRSVIFYHDEKQKLAAVKSKAEAQKQFDDPIVTEVTPLNAFYKAENYHQNYYNNNPNAPYCVFVIKPKLKKLKLDQK